MIQVHSARWLKHDINPAVRAVIVRALADIGICEVPDGSNRSGVIDEYNTRAGAPVGSYWCASALACWSWDSGLWAPRVGLAPSCDAWISEGRRETRLVSTPQLGHAVLYHHSTNLADAVHCGLVVRVSPVVLAVEGNTTVGGTRLERNGTAVALKRVDPQRVMSYVRLT